MYLYITVETHNLSGKELNLVPGVGRILLEGDYLKSLWLGLSQNRGCIFVYTLTVRVLGSYLFKKQQRPFCYAARFKNQHDVEERSQSL